MKTILKLLLIVLLLLPLYGSSQTASNNNIVEINVSREKQGSSEQDYFNFMMEHGEEYSYTKPDGRHIHIYIHEKAVLIVDNGKKIPYYFDKFLESKRYYTGQHTTENGEEIPYEWVIDFLFVKDQLIKVYMGDILLFHIKDLKRKD